MQICSTIPSFIYMISQSYCMFNFFVIQNHVVDEGIAIQNHVVDERHIYNCWSNL